MRRAILWGLLTLAGCASKGPVPALSPLLASEEAVEARRHAPDLVAAAERAHQDAIDAAKRGDQDAAADHATRGRLLFAAARFEALRVQAEEDRIAHEKRAMSADSARRRDEVARTEAEREAHRLLAVAVAEEQAELAFRAAEEVETRAGRVRGPERDRMHREAATFLRRRAELVARAAEALGAPSREVEELVQRLETQNRANVAPAEAVKDADRALREAQALLGRARAMRPGPTRGEIASLLDEAAKRHLGATLEERGIVFDVTSFFPGVAPTPDAVKLGRLADLLRAHPHGSIRVETHAPTTPAAERRAEARAKALAEGLSRSGMEGRRVEFGRGTVHGTERVEVVLPAYGAGVSLPGQEPR